MVMTHSTTGKADRNVWNVAQREASRTRPEPEVFGQVGSPLEGHVGSPESWWRQHYYWLKDCGYLLRPCYSPDWQPLWLGTEKSPYFPREDSRAKSASHVLDATRISDDKRVALKLVKKSDHPYEVDIGRFFSSRSLAGANDNHCVPVYDILYVPDDPDATIMVIPQLLDCRHLAFETIGEAVDCFLQLFTGLQFMHKHRVAHGNCTSRNVMIDPTSLDMDTFHPVDPTAKHKRARLRTQTLGSPKYYWVGFELSRRYDPATVEPKEMPPLRADKTVPEFQHPHKAYDPFPADVFYMGKMIQNDFIQTKDGFAFIHPLIADMVQADPSKRPTMDAVVRRCHAIVADLSCETLRARVVDTEAVSLGRATCVLHGLWHWMRHIGLLISKGFPTIHTPSTTGIYVSSFVSPWLLPFAPHPSYSSRVSHSLV